MLVIRHMAKIWFEVYMCNNRVQTFYKLNQDSSIENTSLNNSDAEQISFICKTTRSIE